MRANSSNALLNRMYPDAFTVECRHWAGGLATHCPYIYILIYMANYKCLYIYIYMNTTLTRIVCYITAVILGAL